MRAALIACALAGCTFPTKPGPPYGCVGDPVPTTAPEIVRIRGRVYDPFALDQPLANVSVSGHVVNQSSSTFAVRTDGTGAFEASEETAGAPHEQYFFAHNPAVPPYADTYSYPAAPVANNTTVTLLQFSLPELVGLAAQTCNCMPSPPSPIMIVAVVDCNGDPVAHATLTVTAAPSDPIYIGYFDDTGVPNPAARETGRLGAAVVTGPMMPGSVTVGATYGTVPFRTHSVLTFGAALTYVEVSP